VLRVSDGRLGCTDTRTAWLLAISGGIHSDAGVVLPVLSGSMGPLIAEGCSMRVVPVPPTGSRTGDIIVFRDGNDLTAHRQIAQVRVLGKYLLLQKGDRNARGSWIQRERVVGVVAEAIDPEGSPLYSREFHAGEARREARHQLLRMALRPLRRIAGVLGRLLCGRWRRIGPAI
jgi:signal peptidase I